MSVVLRTLRGCVAIVVVLAACGDSSVSRTEYADRVDAICADFKDLAGSVVDPAVGSYFEAVDEFAFTDFGLQGYYAMLEALDDSVLVQWRQEMFEDISDLKPPTEGADEFADHIAARRKAFDDERVAISAAADDAELARALWESTESPHLALDHDAILLGIPSCRFG